MSSTHRVTQGRLEEGSTCSKNTGAEDAATVNKAPNAIGKGAKREMNTVKFWLESALGLPKGGRNASNGVKRRTKGDIFIKVSLINSRFLSSCKIFSKQGIESNQGQI
jgi:hypothetical protein